MFFSQCLLLCENKPVPFLFVLFIVPCRRKIDSIISKNTPVYDEDCPDCPESVRFWCFTSGKATDRERVAVTGQASMRVRTTPEVVGSLLEGPSSAAGSLGSGIAAASKVSLSSLVTVMKDAQNGTASARGTSPSPAGSAKERKEKKERKDKKNKKDKKDPVNKEEPKTTKEKQTLART